MPLLTPHLWFNNNAVEAATFWTSLIPDSRIDRLVAAPADNPSVAKGQVLVVEFTLNGRPYAGINGGPAFPFSEAISFAIDCADQAEVDHYWDALIADGGAPSQCGWLKDRFGFSWQVVPRRFHQLIADPDPARAERVMSALMEMVKIDIAALEKAADGT